MTNFQKELEELINKHSQENGSDTPDFILAQYMCAALAAFSHAVNDREQWYGRLNGKLPVTDLVATDTPSQEKPLKSAQEEIYTQVLELLGEDESKYKEVNIYNGYQKDIVGVGKEPNKSAIIRNRFRAKLRNEAKERFNGK